MPPAREDGAPRRDVLAGETAVGATLDAGNDDDLAAVLAAVLLHQHRVRPLGHRRAGEHAQRLAAPRRAAEGMAGGDAPGDRQAGFAPGVEVVEEHGVTVDRRVVVRRHVALGDHVLGENASARRAQSDALGSGDRPRHPGDALERRVDGHQAAAVGEAVVG